MIVSVVIAIAIPLIFLYLIWSVEVFAFNRIRLVIAAFGWGIASFLIALFVQSTLVNWQVLTFNQVALYFAPLFEETIKSLAILWLAQRLYLRYAADGAAYGFAVGTGFAVAENLLYLSLSSSVATELALARVLSVSLMHAFNTAIVGTGVGSSFLRTTRGRVQRFLLTLIVAMLSHFGFNQVASQVSGITLVVAGIVIGLTGTLLIVVLMGRALRQQRVHIDRQLMGNLSPGERAAASNPEQIAAILAEQKGTIGEARADLIRRYTQLLAQRGMLRKAKLVNQRAKYQETIQRQIDDVDRSLSGLRGELGLYARIWLRSVMPSEESEIWTNLSRQLGEPVLNLLVELGERQANISPEDLAQRKSILRAGKLFRELPDDELEDVALLVRVRTAGVGDVIVQRGTVDDMLYVVAAGKLVASAADADDPDSETIITAYMRGDTFGELSMIDLKPHPATVSCIEAVRLYTLTRADLLMLIYAKPQVGLELMRQLVGQIRRQTDLLLWVQQGQMQATAMAIAAGR